MTFLIFLLLNTTYLEAEQYKSNNVYSALLSNKIAQKPNMPNHDNLEKLILKDIPQTKVTLNEKKSLFERNPFLPSDYKEGKNQKGILLNQFRFKGIAKIGKNTFAFIKTLDGINSYKIGQEIGGGFKITKIDDKNMQLELTQKSTTHLLKLNNNEK